MRRSLALAVALALTPAPRLLGVEQATAFPPEEEDDSVQEYRSDPLNDSVVRIIVSQQEFDADSPWRKRNVEIRQTLAAVVAPGTLVVTASAVLDATFLEMSRFGESQRHELTVAFVDQEVNLAVLKIREPLVSARLTPLPLGGLLPLRAAVVALGWQGGQLTRLAAELADIGMRKARTSAYDVASYTLGGFASEPKRSVPVIQRGRLVALVDDAHGPTANAIPASIIRHVLAEPKGEGYRGFASLELETAPLISPEARALYGARSVEGGVRVTSVGGGQGDQPLRRNDILLSVAGHALDEYGRYEHPSWGRVSYKYLLNERHGGDQMDVTVLRDGATRTVRVGLVRHASGTDLLRSPHRTGDGQAFLIFGGLVLQELDRTYLESWGSAWKSTAPIELVMAPRREGAVVLGRVLADEFNQGYQDLADRLVTAVNGERVTTLAEVRAALRSHPVRRDGKLYATVALAYDGGLVVLGYDGLAEAHRRLAAKYDIETPAAFEQLAVGME